MDVNTIRKRYKFMSLKLPLEELAKLSVKDQKQLQDDMRYFEEQLYNVAAKKDVGIVRFNLPSDRTLYIFLQNNKVNMFIHDHKTNHYSQYLSVKELLRISRMDSFLVKYLQEFDKDKNKDLYEEARKHISVIKTLLDKNRMRGSPQKDNNTVNIDRPTIDDDFDFQI